jgi:hypothetical protein
MSSNNDVRLVGIELVTPYKLASTSDMYRVPPPEMLIEGVIPKTSISGITSYPGVGKTWFALEVTRSLACGQSFLGKFKIEKPGSVLFLGSDASLYDYAEQWRRLTRKTWASFTPTEEETQVEGFIEPVNLLEENVRFLVQSDFLFENLDSVRQLIRTCQTHPVGDPYWVGDGDSGHWHQDMGFDLIVFDTLSKLTRANQNDNTEMEEVFRNIRLITETTGAAVLLLHHNSKRNEYNDGSDWRGAMAQIGALDGWLNVSKPYKDKSKVKVEVKKFRGRQPKPFAYRMDVDGELEATLSWIDLSLEREKGKQEESSPEARNVPAPEPIVKGVPDMILDTLARGSRTVSELNSLIQEVLNDEPKETIRNRISVALNALKEKGLVMRDVKSKHYMLSRGVE